MSAELNHQLKNTPVLYSFRRCPFAMRARLALVASQTEVELREIVLRDKPEHMVQLSPKATVPVLWLPNCSVIDESLDIMKWALKRHDPKGWFNLTESEQNEANQLLQQLDGPFKHHLDRYKYASRHKTDPVVHLQACIDILLQWQQRLNQNAYILGDNPTYVDYAMLPFVRQFRIANPDTFDKLDSIPAVQQWLGNYLNSDLYEKIMLKYDPWHPGQTVVFL